MTDSGDCGQAGSVHWRACFVADFAPGLTAAGPPSAEEREKLERLGYF
jgi:hypothetical protein